MAETVLTPDHDRTLISSCVCLKFFIVERLFQSRDAELNASISKGKIELLGARSTTVAKVRYLKSRSAVFICARAKRNACAQVPSSC
jgi:hypothetical protein